MTTSSLFGIINAKDAKKGDTMNVYQQIIQELNRAIDFLEDLDKRYKTIQTSEEIKGIKTSIRIIKNIERDNMKADDVFNQEEK